MSHFVDLAGTWRCTIPGQSGELSLPGTLEEYGFGSPDDPHRQWHPENLEKLNAWHEGDPIVTRLTRSHVFTGKAIFRRRIIWNRNALSERTRVFLECERARELTIQVNGKQALSVAGRNLITPWCFDVTGLVCGDDEITIFSDNSYPTWPQTALTKSSACADETQTNWNGLLGYLRLRLEKEVYIRNVYVYPDTNSINVCIVLDSLHADSLRLTISSPALRESHTLCCALVAGENSVWLHSLDVLETAPRWDMQDGNLHTLTVAGEAIDTFSVTFGLRCFSAREGQFLLNSRPVFLLSEANCAVFPETGYPPMDVESWMIILQSYMAYGVNCMRFHSHCPPEAAFIAADRLGILMQPELSNWDPKDTFADDTTYAYYANELEYLLPWLANHPSFVMLTLGNELHADAEGHKRMHDLLTLARTIDHTRLYADGSNSHYGFLGPDDHSDFYTAMTFLHRDLRATSGDMLGWLNQCYPGYMNYDSVMADIRKMTMQPVFSFEVGQYEILPDFSEIESYHGITRPENLKHFRERACASGLLDDWTARVEASGELSRLCYRAEIEAALQTQGFSGISLLGLQDFPGQGGAFIGMMDAHLRTKPYAFASPETFHSFFSDTVLIAQMPKSTFTSHEHLTIPVMLVHFGKQNLAGQVQWQLAGKSWRASGRLAEKAVSCGERAIVGHITLTLPTVHTADVMTLTLSFCSVTSTYRLWVYPDLPLYCPESVMVCDRLSDDAFRHLSKGRSVFLSPTHLPSGIPCHFSPDFWNVCSFVTQSGTMGQYIDDAHPIFRTFPTDSYTNWQWWPMANQYALQLPQGIKPIVAVLDTLLKMRHLGSLFECRCFGGKVMVSSMRLSLLRQYPEARALEQAIYTYMDSPDFEPKAVLTPEEILALI